MDEIREQIDKGNGVMVTIPVRLGLESVQPEYLPCIKEMFQFESNCGIAGGQLHKAYYFVGIINPQGEDSKIIYLDPHLVQDAVPGQRATSWIRSLCKTDAARGDHWLSPQTLFSQYHCSEIRTVNI